MRVKANVRRMIFRGILGFFVLLLAVTALACSLAPSSPTPSPPSSKLLLIALTPDPASMVEGSSLQFTATGEYTDQRITFTDDLTSQVTWTSSDPTVADISSAGLVTGLSPGDTTITASLSGVTSESGYLTVTVSNTTSDNQ